MTDTPRITRLKNGDWSFGHSGTHRGKGVPECPSWLHHHHDEFCKPPTLIELRMAGIDPQEFKARSRK